ncbi:MAG: phosphonate ABC transporter, permease protein PhnE [Pseudomonadota bacterium]|nr:phosphonate ABC transporter, permease protein PhnE [Pseudomonadota bacterium]
MSDPSAKNHASAVLSLPENQLRTLLARYSAAIAPTRWFILRAMLILLAAMVWAFWMAEIRPDTFIQKIGGFTSYLVRISRLDNGNFVWTDPVEWFWGFKKWSKLMLETLLISYVGTFLGALFAFVFCFFTAANINTRPIFRFICKRGLEFFRTVPDIVFALIFVVAFGVGPLPGVLAIMIHTVGALGKQFSEVVENIDMKPVEGLRASGGNLVQAVRFAVLPQVMANFLTYGLLRFEINVRSATIMGFVGAGGIGDTFLIAIRRFYYSDVSAILVIVIMTVFAIDLFTTMLRRRLGAGSSHE